ncbi:hypothetical protein EXIGLDRAFT_315892 [Exidia glandulosa HHB12029]|uniref:Uncharacterized protein n=1 Tax=Exidia glandulosa HHB12029 TaxID=1314781 RepID=A0A165CXM9_EXIGL|nr:hypothetical protein EXIGLDRAFT_315892 [Exidia glandulosa HHB12029]
MLLGGVGARQRARLRRRRRASHCPRLRSSPRRALKLRALLLLGARPLRTRLALLLATFVRRVAPCVLSSRALVPGVPCLPVSPPRLSLRHARTSRCTSLCFTLPRPAKRRVASFLCLLRITAASMPPTFFPRCSKARRGRFK